jgi:hypothetical protein
MIPLLLIIVVLFFGLLFFALGRRMNVRASCKLPFDGISLEAEQPPNNRKKE